MAPRAAIIQPLFFLFLASYGFALPEGRQSFLIIDEFLDAEPLLLILSEPAPPEIHASGFDDAGDIIGFERDVQITVHDAGAGSVFAVSASGDELTFSAPPSSASTLLVQYDGVDNDSDEIDGQLILDPEGLQSADFTAAGRADAIFLQISSDLDTSLEITVYTDAVTTSVFTLNVVASAGPQEVEIPFADFVGSADFTNVGAMETRLFAATSVDAVYSELFTTGPIVDPNGSKVFLMNPLSCAPDFPNVIPVFRTSSYSTSFTTTTSKDSDDDDDDDDDDFSRRSDDDDDDDDASSFGFGTSLTSREEQQLSILNNFASLSSEDLNELFGASTSTSGSSVSSSRISGGPEGSSPTSSDTTNSASVVTPTLLSIVALALL